ncbi:MAG: transcriptional repressor [Planctomycetota bacterium]
MAKIAEQPRPTTPQDDPLANMPPPLCAIFRRFLRKQGLKFTVERAVILDAVLSQEGVFEADVIADKVAAAKTRVSRATVYRTLKHLTESGILEEVLLDARQTHYRVGYGADPTGQIAVAETGEIIDFPIDELGAMVEKACAEHGVDPISYRFVIHASRPSAATDPAETD